MRVGVAHHLGWAIVVAASEDHRVTDRRRIALIEPGVAAAPVHHEGKDLADEALAELVASVRASATRATGEAVDALAASLSAPIESISLRAWPLGFPREIGVQRRVPYEARADSVMYREVLAEVAVQRGWDVHVFDARTVEEEAGAVLGARADAVLRGPREELGPPWTKDHRMALAATVLAGL